MERKEKRNVLKGDSPDHPHAYTNFYFKMECKVPEEDLYSHTELVAVSPLTSQSVESLPSVDPAAAVESWLANLHQGEGQEYRSEQYDNLGEQYDTPCEQYDTPYTTPSTQGLVRTMFPDIFIRTTPPAAEPVYQNIPTMLGNNKNVKSPTCESKTSPNTIHTTPGHCNKSPCLADKHYACTDILKLHNLKPKKLQSKFAKSEEIIKSYSTPTTSPRSSTSQCNTKQDHKRMNSVDSGLDSDFSQSFNYKLNFFNNNGFSGSFDNIIENSSHLQNVRVSV